MGPVNILAEFFLISLALSLLLFSPLADSRLTGNGFIKLISNVASGSLFLALIVNLTHHGIFFSVTNVLKSIALISTILMSLFHSDQKNIAMWFLYGLFISALGLDLLLFTNVTWPTFLFLLSSTLLMGIITYAMILGHWYLVVPKLSELPLKRAAWILWIILIFKIGMSLYSYSLNLTFFESGTSMGSGYAFNNVLLLMRVLFGYIVILGMSFFNWKLIKLRSIQSSTGVLYAMTFFVFIGELISSFLFFQYGLQI